MKYNKHREAFTEYMMAKKISPAYRHALLTYLDRFLADSTLRKPLDVHNLFAKTSAGQSNNLGKALGQFFNYLELDGVDSAFIASLRKAIPPQNKGIDNDVPTEAKVKESLAQLGELPAKHQAIYNLILDSGLRVSEAVKVLAEFKVGKAMALSGFYRVSTNWFRGNKNSYACFFTRSTYQSLCTYAGSVVGADDFSRSICKHGLTAPKYLRKYAYDCMLSEKLGIPESVCDFIEGRSPKSVSAKHYTSLLRQADHWYGRYADYVSKLRIDVAMSQPRCEYCGGVLTAKEAKAGEYCFGCRPKASTAETCALSGSLQTYLNHQQVA